MVSFISYTTTKYYFTTYKGKGNYKKPSPPLFPLTRGACYMYL